MNDEIGWIVDCGTGASAVGAAGVGDTAGEALGEGAGDGLASAAASNTARITPGPILLL